MSPPASAGHTGICASHQLYHLPMFFPSAFLSQIRQRSWAGRGHPTARGPASGLPGLGGGGSRGPGQLGRKWKETPFPMRSLRLGRAGVARAAAGPLRSICLRARAFSRRNAGSFVEQNAEFAGLLPVSDSLPFAVRVPGDRRELLSALEGSRPCWLLSQQLRRLAGSPSGFLCGAAGG